MDKNLPIIAIVGQPNVGKSTLLNKILGKPLAVTSDVAGTTRDRQYADIAWNAREFTLVDTAGLSLNKKSELETNVAKQIEVAVAEADILTLVVDGKQPASALPQNLLKKFRNSGKELVLIVNKLDSSKNFEEKMGEFQSLGVKAQFGVSSVSGRGIGDLLDYLVSILPPEAKPSDSDAKTVAGIGVSIVGKPNVGKSSIFNSILKEERVVVSPTPGTTRAAIDSRLKINDIDYTFIDTAGLKKKEFRQEEPDVFSGFQTFKSIRRSDVCFFVIDASEEITKQDQRVANEIFAMEKGCIVLANKCDLLDEKKAAGSLGRNAQSISKHRDDKYQSVRDYISHHFPFMWMCPLFFVSAVTNDGLKQAVASIKPIFDRRNKQIDNETLKDFLDKKLKLAPPKLMRDQKKPKVLGLQQVAINPPIFELFVNYPAAISMQFRKYLENSIIKELDFYGTPIVLKLRGKDKS